MKVICTIHAYVWLSFFSLVPVFASDINIVPAGPEQLLISNRDSSCTESQLIDSPARALRRSNGSLVLYATHFNNWYMTGQDWKSIKPVCASSVKGAENPDPAAADDRHWIQALVSDDGIHVVALASQEYMGSRHGRCNAAPTATQPFPCWYSSITQFESSDGALSFRRSTKNPIVATPQLPFDKNKTGRVGFLTASNIVTDGAWRYVLIYVDGYGRQKAGTCIFRGPKAVAAPSWLGWNGQAFSVELNKIPSRSIREGSEAVCTPLALGSINRGLVRDRISGAWIAVGPYRQHSSGRDRPGIYYSVSQDLLNWGSPKLLAELTINYQPPSCPPVYKYPSIIDHSAPGFTFDSIGDEANLYLTKVSFANCKYVGRQLVRIPLTVSR
jgi:hypothetical protein